MGYAQNDSMPFVCEGDTTNSNFGRIVLYRNIQKRVKIAVTESCKGQSRDLRETIVRHHVVTFNQQENNSRQKLKGMRRR